MAVPQFSRGGLGFALASVFEARLRRRPCLLTQAPRGRQFLMLCDIGGSQKAQPFETYSFLALDLDQNPYWLQDRAEFRKRVFVQRRRMAFKAMNDGARRRALRPFLQLSEVLNGVLVTFAIHKIERPEIGFGGAAADELVDLWKPAVIDRLMWMVYLAAFLVSGLSVAGQDVMFILDEDEVAANVTQLTKLTEIFGRAVANQQGPMMGHLRCGTTKSDDGSLALEDLAALPDLAAGAVAEFVCAYATNGAGPISPLIQRLPSSVSWKTRTILPWVLSSGEFLNRVVCLIDGLPSSTKWRATIPEWFVAPGIVDAGRGNIRSE